MDDDGMGLRHDADQSQETNHPHLMWWLRKYAHHITTVLALLHLPAYVLMYIHKDGYFEWAYLADHFLTCSAAFLLYYCVANRIWHPLNTIATIILGGFWAINLYVILFGADYGNYISTAGFVVSIVYFGLFIYFVTRK